MEVNASHQSDLRFSHYLKKDIYRVYSHCMVVIYVLVVSSEKSITAHPQIYHKESPQLSLSNFTYMFSNSKLPLRHALHHLDIQPA